jgi:hypothetical protein
MDQRPILIVPGVEVGMKRRDTWERGASLGGFGQVFVTVEANGDADLGFSPSCSARIRYGSDRLQHAQNAAPAAHSHALAQGDFRGHLERDLDFGSFAEGCFGKKEDSARTEILGEADAFERSSALPNREREKIQKSLSNTALNSNWSSGHGGVRSLPNRRGERTRYFSSGWAAREVLS